MQSCRKNYAGPGAGNGWAWYTHCLNNVCNNSPKACAKALGRVKPGGSPATQSTLTICEKAKQARARNSPAAGGLEESCRNAMAAEVGTGTTDK